MLLSSVPARLPSDDVPPVLVADDDPDVRSMLRTLLELDGHEVLEAKDGEQAWQVCLETQPSVVVADIQMPGIDGLELCRKIRQSKHSTDIKVIVYTAGMATAEQARSAGCDEYFLKTDPLPRLRDKVRQYVSARPGRSPS
ncbi:MAG TPA: response regulator [Candidatus Dormibacteraeota bacterium]|jgi:CheY-like chemotaxis protein|nr:response regulator [Candidatus Dormibacteraeota bacterium]